MDYGEVYAVYIDDPASLFPFPDLRRNLTAVRKLKLVARELQVAKKTTSRAPEKQGVVGKAVPTLKTAEVESEREVSTQKNSQVQRLAGSLPTGGG